MKKLQNRKGFTLVELLIVMAIIGILVLIAVPRFARSTDSARIRTLQANARTMASAVSMYIADNNGISPKDQTALFGGGSANKTGDATAVVYLDQATFSGTTVKPANATYAFDKNTGIVTATVPVDKMKSEEAPEGVTISNNVATVTIDVTK